MNHRFKPVAIATAVAFALTLASGAAARIADTDEKALIEARAELARAAKRVAELSRKLGYPAHAPVLAERRFERRPVLGVVLAADDERGVRVAGVTPDSGAAKAGLRGGDRIVSIDGRALKEGDGLARADQARQLLGNLDVKRPVAIEYERDGKRASVEVAPQLGERAVILSDARGLRLGGPVGVMEGVDGALEMEADSIERFAGMDGPQARRIIRHEIRGTGAGDIEEIELAPAPGVAPRVHREIIRLGPGDCGGKPCRLPVIAEALRWNGLNLASVDAQLGRYFGTDRGVLVLSIAPEFAGLQAGDVIRSIDGKPVTSPREAMAALRGRDAGSKVDVAYLRDRKPATTQVTVPKAMPLHVPLAPPAPPAPPAPDAPPAPPAPAPLPTPGALPAPPAPPAAPTGATPAAPPAPPAPPVPSEMLVLV